MDNILITGGAGFIGINFVNYLLNKYKNINIVVLDKLTYASNFEILQKNIKFIKGDIADKKLVSQIFDKNKIEIVVNFAAESHVDNSINTPDIFMMTNVVGTQTLLEIARHHDIKKFIQISTDEVYGSLPISHKKFNRYGDDLFTEKNPLKPSSPYSSSKASADLIALSYHYTYNTKVIITRCSNNFGRFQHSEKFIPKTILSALNNEDITIYGNGENVRDWISVEDHIRGIEWIIKYGKIGEIYNIGANNEYKNIDLAYFIINYLKSKSKIKFVVNRKGHDLRYGIDASKIKNLGWSPQDEFYKSLIQTIEFYRDIQKNKKGS